MLKLLTLDLIVYNGAYYFNISKIKLIKKIDKICDSLIFFIELLLFN